MSHSRTSSTPEPKALALLGAVRGTSVKPFRIARVDVAPGATVELQKSLELAHRSIRRLHFGSHVVELQVKGVRQPMGAFELTV